MPIPQLPKVPRAGTANAAMSSHFELLGAAGSEVMLWLDGTGLPMQFGHSALRVPWSDLRLEFWTVMGKPERAWKMADIFQPPRIASAKPGQLLPHFLSRPKGSSYLVAST